MIGTPMQRLVAKFVPEPNSGCWLWTASCDSKGYGKIYVNGKLVGAHRVAYELFVGPIPDGLHIDHLCRVRCCVNPSHMEPVTHAENIRRGDSGKATALQQRAKTHCPHGHEYNEENTHIRKNRNGARVCRTCARESMRARI